MTPKKVITLPSITCDAGFGARFTKRIWRASFRGAHLVDQLVAQLRELLVLLGLLLETRLDRGEPHLRFLQLGLDPGVFRFQRPFHVLHLELGPAFIEHGALFELVEESNERESSYPSSF